MKLQLLIQTHHPRGSSRQWCPAFPVTGENFHKWSPVSYEACVTQAVTRWVKIPKVSTSDYLEPVTLLPYLIDTLWNCVCVLQGISLPPLCSDMFLTSADLYLQISKLLFLTLLCFSLFRYPLYFLLGFHFKSLYTHMCSNTQFMKMGHIPVCVSKTVKHPPLTQLQSNSQIVGNFFPQRSDPVTKVYSSPYGCCTKQTWTMEADIFLGIDLKNTQ